jgi:hypothetical protein
MLKILGVVAAGIIVLRCLVRFMSFSFELLEKGGRAFVRQRFTKGTEK